MATRIIEGPFNRVEGDLEIALEVEAGHVRRAEVNSPLFRGFEIILRGKDPRDALTITPRICGICSVSQSAAAAAALAEAQGIRPTDQGLIATALIRHVPLRDTLQDEQDVEREYLDTMASSRTDR